MLFCESYGGLHPMQRLLHSSRFAALPVRQTHGSERASSALFR
jgi:hypothetical protein